MTQILSNLRTVSLNLKEVRVNLPFVNYLRSKMSDIECCKLLIRIGRLEVVIGVGRFPVGLGPIGLQDRLAGVHLQEPQQLGVPMVLGYSSGFHWASWMTDKPPLSDWKTNTTGLEESFFRKLFPERFRVFWKGFGAFSTPNAGAVLERGGLFRKRVAGYAAMRSKYQHLKSYQSCKYLHISVGWFGEA